MSCDREYWLGCFFDFDHLPSTSPAASQSCSETRTFWISLLLLHQFLRWPCL